MGTFLATRDQARRSGVHHEGCAFDLRRQRGDVRLANGVFGSSERSAGYLRLRRRIAIPATTSSWAALDAGRARRACARPRRGDRSAGGAGPRDCAACAAFTRSPCSSSVARAASSAFAGQPRLRDTSAISASTTTHLARATASFGPKARAALRTSAFARTRSPNCAIATPPARAQGRRHAGRPASMRRADQITCRESARAAVISESIGIPSHL
jgi:hypothetical protein